VIRQGAEYISIITQGAREIVSGLNAFPQLLHHALKAFVSLIAAYEAKGAVKRQACNKKVGEIEKKTDDMLFGNPPLLPASYGLDSDRKKPARLKLPGGVLFRERIGHSPVYCPTGIPRLVFEKTHTNSVISERSGEIHHSLFTIHYSLN
jgi:hypothetical protein